MLEHFIHFRKVCPTRRGRWVSFLILLAILILVLQISLPKRRHALSPALQTICREGGLWNEGSAPRHVGILSGGSRNYKCQSPVPHNSADGLTELEMATKPENFPSPGKFAETGKFASTRGKIGYSATRLWYGKSKVADGSSVPTYPASPPLMSYANEPLQEKLVHSKDTDMNVTFRIYLSTNEAEELTPHSRHVNPVPSSFPTLFKYGTISTGNIMVQKRNNGITPISEMKSLLFSNHAFTRAMRPRWSSAPDWEMLDAKRELHNAPTVKDDHELYAPAFWNFSMFKRSYELMEKTLKVYIYREGQKPIFHQPVLDGIYASEGWFMKQIEENAKFVVNDPGKAHLFYIPFSSSTLRFSLYVPGPHAKRHLLQYLNNYVHAISTKYPFWNRTGGADHFLVACHDWALYVTNGSVRHSIRALCNSDISKGFELGKDVSLPEANVLTAQNPLGDVGGRPPKRRHFLAFFAGKLHGNVRPMLLKHWENKDPDMKIFGRLTCGMKCKITYAQYMKNSKYCICPSGYHAFSPRVVEAILYECVPVIISDNYVPPFFDILNWEAFAVIIAEKDVPFLKDILLSIPNKKYISLQLGVRKVQRHFLWHTKPVKYDMFHMILHSVWFSRLNQGSTGDLVGMERIPGIFTYNNEGYVIHLHRGMGVDVILRDIVDRWKLTSEDVVLKCVIPERPNSSMRILNGDDVDRMIDMHMLVGSKVMNVEVFIRGDGQVTIDRPSSGQPSSGQCSGTNAVLNNCVSDSTQNLRKSDLWNDIIHSVGQIFNSVEHLRSDLARYAISRGFDYSFVKNDLTRVTVCCKLPHCSWSLHAIRIGKGPHFKIKNLHNVHTCGGGLSTQKHPRASKKWVSSIIMEKIEDTPLYRAKDIKKDIFREYGVDIPYHQAWLGKDLAYRELHGDDRCSFDSLRWYKEAVERTNPNSIVELDVSSDNRFRRFFICFHACVVGFEMGCRPMLFLDGTFKKDKYKGILLSATALNGENQLFPLAYAACDIENEDNWEWFLFQLKKAVSDCRRITFISDRCKGLLEAIPRVFPTSHNAYCLRHLKANFSKQVAGKYRGSTKQALLSLFDQAAYAFRVEDHEAALHTMGGISQEAEKWARDSNPNHWANANFQGERFGEMYSNAAESFNAWVLEARNLPILHMVDRIRVQIMDLAYRRRNECDRWETRLCPSIDAKIRNLMESSRGIIVNCSNGVVFE